MLARKLPWMVVVLAVAVAVAMALPGAMARGGGPKDRPVVYVRSQGLYYDSIVTTDLPPHGPFQRLYHPDYDEVTQLETEYGPGDVGYVGGRWWVDVDGDDMMGPGDMYFGCPLLGPGRESP